MQSPSVTTLSAGQSATATVTIGGTIASPTYKFDFGIPRGADGSTPTSIPWGNITGDIANQTDLVSALQGKANASALSSYATQVYVGNEKNDAVYLASLYTDSAVGALSSVYAPIDFVSGTNDGTNWTSMTIGSETYGFAAGGSGGDAVWGSITGTLSNQTDLMSKFSEYVKLTDIPDISNLASETYVDSAISALSSVYATQNELSNYAKVSDLSNYTPLSEMSLYASVSALNSAISGLSSVYASIDALSNYASQADLSAYALSSTVDNLNYASVHALSEDTVIPDITGLASEGYVNSQISALSSVYAPIGSYATTSELSSAIESLSSVYASVSGTKSGNYWQDITINGVTGSFSGGAGSNVFGQPGISL